MSAGFYSVLLLAVIVSKLETGVHTILAEPDVAKKFAAFGAIPADEDLKIFVERIEHETSANEAIVSNANPQVDK